MKQPVVEVRNPVDPRLAALSWASRAARGTTIPASIDRVELAHRKAMADVVALVLEVLEDRRPIGWGGLDRVIGGSDGLRDRLRALRDRLHGTAEWTTEVPVETGGTP